MGGHDITGLHSLSESLKNELKLMNNYIHSAVESTKRQNAENQELFDQGVILSKIMNKNMKKFK
jgi:hypothetical protein